MGIFMRREEIRCDNGFYLREELKLLDFNRKSFLSISYFFMIFFSKNSIKP